jgi:hypothetical protein
MKHTKIKMDETHKTSLTTLLESGFPLNLSKVTTNWAAKNGFLKCLELLHKHECPLSMETMNIAARFGHLEVMVFVKEIGGFEYSKDTVEQAVCGNHVNILQYFYEKSVAWPSEILFQACEYGSLECLKYLHQHGCRYFSIILILYCLFYVTKFHNGVGDEKPH